jgi:DNA repair protein RecO (recombination protein O)
VSLTKCKAIVLSTVKYGDSAIILKCYTDKSGLQSYMIPGIRSKTSIVKPSQLLPLSLLEIDANQTGSKGMHRIKEVKSFPPLQNIPYDINKSSIALFIAETLSRCIREENHADEKLFGFLIHSIQILDLETAKISNFTCFFMIQLLKYIGFSPEFERAPETSGNSSVTANSTAQLTDLFMKSSYSTYQSIQMSGFERTQLLESILDYFSRHVSNFGTLKSYPVLKTLFE